jgi:hypothetical protein
VHAEGSCSLRESVVVFRTPSHATLHTEHCTRTRTLKTRDGDTTCNRVTHLPDSQTVPSTLSCRLEHLHTPRCTLHAHGESTCNKVTCSIPMLTGPLPCRAVLHALPLHTTMHAHHTRRESTHNSLTHILACQILPSTSSRPLARLPTPTPHHTNCTPKIIIPSQRRIFLPHHTTAVITQVNQCVQISPLERRSSPHPWRVEPWNIKSRYGVVVIVAGNTRACVTVCVCVIACVCMWSLLGLTGLWFNWLQSERDGEKREKRWRKEGEEMEKRGRRDGEEMEKRWRRDGEEREKRWRREGEEMEKRGRRDGEEMEKRGRREKEGTIE